MQTVDKILSTEWAYKEILYHMEVFSIFWSHSRILLVCLLLVHLKIKMH